MLGVRRLSCSGSGSGGGRYDASRASLRLPPLMLGEESFTPISAQI